MAKSRSAQYAQASKAKLLGLFFTGLVIAGCDTVTDGVESFNPFIEPIVYACPEVRILSDAANITAYKPGSPKDVLDILYRGRFEVGDFACEWDLDPQTAEGSLTMEVTPMVNATRGPALQGDEMSVPYFVTVTDKDRKVLSKAQFDLRANIPAGASALQLRDRKVIIETPVRAAQNDLDFLVFVGFQLSPDQLDYNRAERQKRIRQ